MKIEHLAIWVKDLEKMKAFYTKYFNLNANDIYRNMQKGFSSYFLTFNDNSARLELMNMNNVFKEHNSNMDVIGLAHFAISVGSKEKVDLLTEKLRKDNYTIKSEARTTGDGYYESVVLDPEGNQIEITV